MTPRSSSQRVLVMPRRLAMSRPVSSHETTVREDGEARRSRTRFCLSVHDAFRERRCRRRTSRRPLRPLITTPAKTGLLTVAEPIGRVIIAYREKWKGRSNSFDCDFRGKGTTRSRRSAYTLLKHLERRNENRGRNVSLSSITGIC